MRQLKKEALQKEQKKGRKRRRDGGSEPSSGIRDGEGKKKKMVCFSLSLSLSLSLSPSVSHPCDSCLPLDFTVRSPSLERLANGAFNYRA
jgi:hypothetical protein